LEYVFEYQYELQYDLNMAKFRTPDKMNFDKDVRVPISSRVSRSTRNLLEKAANKRKVSLTALVEKVLEEYAELLVNERYVTK